MTSQQEGRRSLNRQQRKNLYIVGALAATVFTGLSPILLRDLDGPVSAAIVLAAGALICLFSLLWFAALDELAKQAHYEAWFWGGSIGLLALPLLSIAGLLVGGGSEMIDALLALIGAADDASVAFVSGVLVTLAPLVIGYGVWWLVFWLRRL